VPLLLFAAFLAAVIGAIVVVVVVDVREGKLVERWQIERLLGRPVLGEVEVHQLPRHGMR
jgi:capsular polysaccharide biosynthesis protein